MTDLKNETVWKILDESVGIGSVPLFVICHIHFPHCFKIRFQSFTAFVLVDNCFSTIFFLLPYQNFACPVLKSKIHNEVELKMYYYFVLAEYLSINCSKFNPRKIIFPLQQNIFSTPDVLSYFTNWIVLTNFRRRQTHDKHKNNIVTNGWLLFLGNLLPRFLSYSASRGWVG